MIVQHNISGMNANRQLNITTGLQAKSAEKLSSGYRINRAADDAAGLAISEKMRRQIRGLSQASENTQDGISYVQVADAALAEIDEMLARMNGLCIQAANDTLTPADRQAIDEEIQQLKVEMNRTFHTTSFNEKLIWDERTPDRKSIGTESRPIYTLSTGDSYDDRYYLSITETNKAAWPKDNQIKISADTSGVKLSWTGYDGISYQSKNIEWPSEEELKKGFDIGLNSTTMDYGTYPGAQGITPKLKLTLDEDADLDKLVSALNNSYVSTSAKFSLSGTVQGDSRSSISGSMNYNAGLVSRNTLSGSEDHTDPTNGGANRQNAGNTSTISFTYNFNKNSKTQPSTPSTFGVTAKYSGIVYTKSDERSAETENVWWYYYRGTIRSTSEIFSNPDFETAINNALNGTASNNSLIDSSSKGGDLYIDFELTTSESPKWGDTGQAVSNIGRYTLKMSVDESETAGDVITRIANITGADITSSEPSSMELWNSSYKYFDANIYAGTMQLNIQAGSESADNNVIPIVYDVLNNNSLKINDLDTLTRENALEGVEKIKVAAQIVDEQRSIFGAYQNRMEHTVKNLDNVVENTQSAESVIRDTDMAAEMVKYSNNNILMQAGQSILAQANQSNQGVMALLR